MVDKEKLENFIDQYISAVKQKGLAAHIKDERYKFEFVDNFQRHFDLEVSNLKEMIEKAIGVENLVSGGNYYPRKMLITFADQYPNETREALKYLFDEKIDVKERLVRARAQFEEIKLTVLTNNPSAKNSYMDLRFLTLLLSSKTPIKYYPIKTTEFKNVFKIIYDAFNSNIKEAGRDYGKQYEVYSRCADLICNRIKEIDLINELRLKFTEGLDFKDSEYKWMTQDVIYVGSKIITSGEKPPNLTPVEPQFSPENRQLLEKKKQIILYGPPGTGKTFCTRGLAVELIKGEF